MSDINSLPLRDARAVVHGLTNLSLHAQRGASVIQSGKGVWVQDIHGRDYIEGMPDVATFIENGVADFEASSWVGLLAPAKTPRAIITRLNTELTAVLNDPEVKERLNGMGITASPGTAESFGAELSRDLAKYGPVVKAAGIKAE